MTWLDNIRAQPVLTVARLLGLETKSTRGASAGSIFGCPACSAKKRHTKRRDKRGAIGLRGDGKGWQCHQCGQTGDGLDLVSLFYTGARFADSDNKAAVRDWCTCNIGGDVAYQHYSPVPARISLAEIIEYEYERAQDLWDACHPLSSDPDVVGYLKHREIENVDYIESQDLCRALPNNVRPDWTKHCPVDGVYGYWADTGHRLIVPLYDEFGIIRSVVARLVRDPVNDERKSSTRGVRSGLVMADVVTRNWFMCSHYGADEGRTLVIAEGEIDYLKWCGLSKSEPCNVGVMAVVSGSWKQKYADVIPKPSGVYIDTDHDEQGDKYAYDIRSSFNGLDVTIVRSVKSK